MSNCPPEIHLSAYLDGELADERQAAIEDHLNACPLCGRVVGAFRQVDAAVAAHDPPPVTDGEWEDAWGAVIDRVRAPAPHVAAPEPEPAGWRQRLGGIRWLAAAAVLAAAIGLGSYFGLAPHTARTEATREGEPCVVEYLEPADGYVSVYTHSQEADLTLITVVPAEERQEPRP